MFAVKSLRIAMDDRAVFLDGDLGEEGFGAVFASPSYYGAHRLAPIINVVLVVPFVPIGSVSWFYQRAPVQLEPQKYDNIVSRATKWVKMGWKRYNMSQSEKALNDW